ncbi:nickel-responsive transcriptional regulator NikR [Solimonas marina]|uniref:Putative nickel-responsive regulator n=1 Tax=Solimonas marina TaxID=2714601 RepID=A0A970B7V7_9GAMM|nr:nickel-responsive transcriptional regulator NikR [Solimonas marina]
MRRYTISIEDELGEQFEAWAQRHGYENRSEAIRDLLRDRLGAEQLGDDPQAPCVAATSYVYDHEELDLSRRLIGHQHAHHDLNISTLHVHLDSHLCMEVTVLQGPHRAVLQHARALTAERGVRHGQIHVVPLGSDGAPESPAMPAPRPTRGRRRRHGHHDH